MEWEEVASILTAVFRPDKSRIKRSLTIGASHPHLWLVMPPHLLVRRISPRPVHSRCGFLLSMVSEKNELKTRITLMKFAVMPYFRTQRIVQRKGGDDNLPVRRTPLSMDAQAARIFCRAGRETFMTW